MNKLDQSYQALLNDILTNGRIKSDRTGTGTISVFGREIRHNMADGFPLLTCKKMPWRPIVTELLWFLRGDTNIKYLVDNNCNIWNGDAHKVYKHVAQGNTLTLEEFGQQIKADAEFAKTWGELGPVYGKQWRAWRTQWYQLAEIEGYTPKSAGSVTTEVDQIIELVNNLKNNPDSRRLMVNAWNVGDISSMVLPPCHYGFECNTRLLSTVERGAIQAKRNNFRDTTESRLSNFSAAELNEEFDSENIPTRALSLKWIQRSVDTFLGLPFNIASYGLLLSILANEVNMVPEELIGSLGDTHLYLNHKKQALEVMDNPTHPLPRLIINDEFWNPENILIGGFDSIIKGMEYDDFQLLNYVSEGVVKAPLSN